MVRRLAASLSTSCLLAAVPAVVVSPLPAQAHLGNISYADFTVRGGDVLLRFRYAAHVTPGMPRSESPVTRPQLMALEGGIEKWIGGASRVESAAGPCSFALDNLIGPDREQDLEVTAVWACPAQELKGLHIVFHPLGAIMDEWRTIASIRIGGKDYSTVFDAGAVRWIVGEPFASSVPAVAGGAPEPADGGSSSFGRFFRLGVHHIWTGYDHLLFLLAVLLAGGGLARLAAIVTSFTLAHSLTLGAAATGLVRLPVAPVEAAIALSIVAVAVENIAQRGADRRALVTFAFGLVHGFGFASVLAETALPVAGVLVPLLAFNLGVEAGQLAVVAVVVPVLAVALRSRHGRRFQVVLSALVAVAGAAWAVERIASMLG